MSPLTTRSEIASKNLMDQSGSLRLTIQPGEKATAMRRGQEAGEEASGPAPLPVSHLQLGAQPHIPGPCMGQDPSMAWWSLHTL